MNLFTFSFKNIIRRKVRTIFTIISIGIIVAVFFSLIAFSSGYSQSLGKEFSSFGIHILAVPKGCPYEATSLLLHGGEMSKTLTYSQFEEVAKNKYIDIASPLILIHSNIISDNYKTAIYGIEESLFKLKPYWRLNGKMFSNDSNEAIVGANLAKDFNLKIGDNVYLPDKKVELKVSGILSFTGTSDDNFLYVPLKYAQELTGKSGAITAIAIKVKPNASIGMVASILSQIPDVQTTTYTQVQSTLNGLVSTTKQLLLFATIFTLLLGIIGLINTVYMSVSERKKELGMLKAIGAKNSQIFSLVIIETVIIVLIGSILGLILSISFSQLIEVLIRKLVEIAPPGKLANYSIYSMFLTIITAIIIGIISSIIPAYSASKIPPIEVIRNE